VLRGQISIEFFFATVMAFLATFWLLNYVNQARTSGIDMAVRQEQLIAAEVGSAANEVCLTNSSITLRTPCIFIINQSVLYSFNASPPGSNKLMVFSPDVPGVWNASTVCPLFINLTAFDADPGIMDLRWVFIACNINNRTFSQRVCLFKNQSRVVMSLGSCNQ
jgi:hypothetical protein